MHQSPEARSALACPKNGFEAVQFPGAIEVLLHERRKGFGGQANDPHRQGLVTPEVLNHLEVVGLHFRQDFFGVDQRTMRGVISEVKGALPVRESYRLSGWRRDEDAATRSNARQAGRKCSIGIGTMLEVVRADHIVEILAQIANRVGERFVSREQVPMAHLLRRVGLIVVTDVDAGVLHVRFDRFDAHHRIVSAANIQHGCPITDPIQKIAFIARSRERLKITIDLVEVHECDIKLLSESSLHGPEPAFIDFRTTLTKPREILVQPNRREESIRVGTFAPDRTGVAFQTARYSAAILFAQW